MKNIYFYFLSVSMLLIVAMPSMAQSARLDSLQRLKEDVQLQGERLQLQYDSIYRIIAQCKTDDERLVHIAVKEKLDKKSNRITQQKLKLEDEINVEIYRIEQEKRDADLAQKQAAVQAVTPIPLKGETNSHQWVDLGLPSGTKWATCNVGAKDIHGVGTRIAWGETATKKLFSPDTYTQNNVEIASYAGNPIYDLATAKWGEQWYTPTLQQWEELLKYCVWDYVMVNGVYGVLFTSRKTYNTIFLPSTGFTDDCTYKLKYTTYNLAYWTSTGISTNGAHTYIANYEQGYMSTANRYVAHCVRAVCDTLSEQSKTVQEISTVVQDASTTVQESSPAIQDTSSSSSSSAAAAIQHNTKTNKKSAKNAEKTAKNIKKTANAVKKTAQAVKILKNIFN